MIKIFFAAGIITAFASCQNFDSSSETQKTNEAKQTERPTVNLAPVPRNISINTENAYNDLFFRQQRCRTFYNRK